MAALQRARGFDRGNPAQLDLISIALEDEIAALAAGVKASGESVAEATEQRKEKHEEFSAPMASKYAAKGVFGLG